MASENNTNSSQVSPGWVGVALVFLPPLGLFLFWDHPVLKQNQGWKKVAVAWCGIWLLIQLGNLRSGDRGTQDTPEATANASQKAEDSHKEIEAPALLELGNAAAIRSKYPDRFVVAGRVLDIESDKSYFGGDTYTIRIIGTTNASGLVNSWVNCEMNENGGLDKIGPGHFVRVEGEFDRSGGSFVWMKKCCLWKGYHVY